jgi:hypothetical protein
MSIWESKLFLTRSLPLQVVVQGKTSESNISQEMPWLVLNQEARFGMA